MTLPRLRDGGLLGVAWLLPPLAWLTQLQINYALVEPACTAQREYPLYLVLAATAAIVAASAGLAWRGWRQTAAELSPVTAARVERTRFIAVVGLVVCAVIGLAVVAQTLALVVLDPCH